MQLRTNQREIEGAFNLSHGYQVNLVKFFMEVMQMYIQHTQSV